MQQGNIKKALDNLDNAGYRLRCAREYMGLSEKEVADELKLMVSHVRAIEQNRSEYLVQRKPFERYLRAYARLVQLNPDTIVDMYFAKSEPEPTQPVNITTRLEVPPQAVVMPPVKGRNYYHPAILATGFVVIGLSLFAGWGVKQMVGSSQSRPQLAQSDRIEVRASNRRQAVAAAAQELETVRFERPVTSVPPASDAELTPALQPIDVTVKRRAVAAQPVAAAAERVEKVPLQNFTVGVEPRAIVESQPEPEPKPKPEPTPEPKRTVASKAVSEKTSVAIDDVAPKARATLQAKTPSKPKRIVATNPVETAESKAEARAAKRVVEDKTASTTLPAVNKPALQPVTVASAGKRASFVRREVDDVKAQSIVTRNTGESSAAKVAVVTADRPAAAPLQPLKVGLKQRITPQTVQAEQTLKADETPEADDLQQIIASGTALRSENMTQSSGTGFVPGSELEDEVADLDAVIDDTIEDVQPFETALANSSDSASVARLALLESYKSTLRRRVYENVAYPGKARRRNQEGRVVMHATVSRGGELLSVETAEPSKYRSLNRASEKAIKRASPFPAAPDTLSGDTFVLTVPVVFKVPKR